MVNRQGGKTPLLPFVLPVGWEIVSSKRGITKIRPKKKD